MAGEYFHRRHKATSHKNYVLYGLTIDQFTDDKRHFVSKTAQGGRRRQIVIRVNKTDPADRAPYAGQPQNALTFPAKQVPAQPRRGVYCRLLLFLFEKATQQKHLWFVRSVGAVSYYSCIRCTFPRLLLNSSSPIVTPSLSMVQHR